MTSRERMNRAMRPRAGQLPDRVPVMCQLSLGHYFLHAAGGAVEIWHDTAAFGDALLAMRRRYGFDGILVNLPGRDPRWRGQIASVEPRGRDTVVHWANGAVTTAPPDDNPHVRAAGGEVAGRLSFAGADPERLFYVEPHGQYGVTHVAAGEIPEWQFDTITYVRERAPDVSVHGEVFSPFSQWLELLEHADALMALVEDAGPGDGVPGASGRRGRRARARPGCRRCGRHPHLVSVRGGGLHLAAAVPRVRPAV